MLGTREATIDDYACIERIVRQVHRLHFSARPDCFREWANHFSQATFGNWLDDAEAQVLVAEDEPGAVCGYVMAVRSVKSGHPLLRDRTLWLIEDLGVDEARRGHGVGTALMRRSLEEGKRRGCNDAELSVWAFNASAHRFYEAIGFADRNIRMDIPLLG